MRGLDKNFVTPTLRKHDLIRLNADGFMMTRSLAENYPYSKFYKAALRGGKSQWLTLTESIETKQVDPEAALRVLIALLLNRRAAFEQTAITVLNTVATKLPAISNFAQVEELMQGFVNASTYSARVFENCLHSLFQALDELHCLEYFVKPLSQMRSANKKHGNIGDIELVRSEASLDVVEAWDAKFGKPYLRDELEELAEKLAHHGNAETVGFVVDGEPNLKHEITERLDELQQLHGVSIVVCGFHEWVSTMQRRAESVSEQELAQAWLTAFAESLCQKRRDRAPIDEPCDVWLTELLAALSGWLSA